jgi:hypothetical protein
VFQMKLLGREIEGQIVEVNGRRAYIRSDEGDYIGSREHFIFDSKYGHSCLVEGMPVIFDIVQNISSDARTKGRVRADKIKIVNWLYPSFLQAELSVINWGRAGGAAEMACGCHVSLYREQFLTADEYVDDPTILHTGAKLAADVVIREQRPDGVFLLKATNIEILRPQENGDEGNLPSLPEGAGLG